VPQHAITSAPASTFCRHLSYDEHRERGGGSWASAASTSASSGRGRKGGTRENRASTIGSMGPDSDSTDLVPTGGNMEVTGSGQARSWPSERLADHILEARTVIPGPR